MKVFEKVKKENGSRVVYFCGIKICSYKKCQSAKKIYNKYLSLFNEASWECNKDASGYTITKDNFKVFGEADNTLWTGYAVLCQDEYAFFDANDSYIMIDIGLNLGFSSLKLATREHIKCIYGFEPFVPTFKLAEKNLSFNPDLSQKINIFNFGLSNENKTAEIHYNPDLPGSMSSVQDRFKDSKNVETIELKSASEVLKPILEKHNEKVFVKIDCEGAEIEILPDLETSGLLKKVDLIIMEWHFGNYKQIIDILTRNDFLVTCRYTANDTGMITAFKKSK